MAGDFYTSENFKTMDKININLSDELSVEITYSLNDDQIIITDIELTEGTLIELIHFLDEDGDLNSVLTDKVNEILLLNFSELDELENEDGQDL